MGNVVDNIDDDSDSKENGIFNNTRRQFVAGSAALGGIAVGTGLAIPSLAQDQAPPEPIQNEFEDDVDILNYALTLERLEAEFYRQGLENFEASDFTLGEPDSEAVGEEPDEGMGNEAEDSGMGNETEDGEVGGEEEAETNETTSQQVAGSLAQEGNETDDDGVGNETEDGGMGNETEDSGMGNETEDGEGTDQAAGAETEAAGEPYSELQTILAHEEEHVQTLQTTIEDQGGEVAPEPEVEFGSAVEDPMEFLGTAIQLEDIGVSAYAGAAPFIQNDDLVAPALSIHSVEGRHAAFVRTLMGQTAFPNAFDQARSRSEVLELAGQFINNIEEFEPDEAAMEEGDEDRGTPEISIEEFRNQTQDDEVGNETGAMGNETEGGVGNETEGGVGNETDGNATGGNTTES
jgi:rubrerythrin